MSLEPRPLIGGAGPRPITSSADILAALPDGLLEPEMDPVRDALVEALYGLLDEWQYRSDYAAAQADITRALNQYLDAQAADRSASRAKGEEDEPLRSRALGQQAVVTETAIVAAVNAILSLYTTTECQLLDGALDGWFIHDGTDGNGGPAKWHSFLGGGPHYPDRLFTDDAINNDGAFRPNSRVETARCFQDAVGRQLLLRVPDLGFNLRDAALVFDDTVVPEFGFFVGDGTTVPAGAFLDASSEGPLALYRAIANLMDTVVGQSIRWDMTSDIAA